MDGKQLRLEKATSVRQQGGQTRRPTLLLIATAVICCGLIILRSLNFEQHIRPASLKYAGQRRQGINSEVFKYPGERIEWKPCGQVNGRPLECSSIDVPMDHSANQSSDNRTFSVPLIRMRDENATQNLIVNPGGPGGSGFDMIYMDGEEIKSIIGEGFHLLSFDPRGVNSSRPLATCYPDQETRERLSGHHYTDPVGDSPEVYAWTTNFVHACSDTMGDYGKYINTPQTAADMNSILEALGQEDMVFWGFSYGSLLGQTYATMFPDRSRRIIIDGITNQFDWYEALIEDQDFIDSDKVLYGIFDECVKAGSNCTLSALADTTEDLYGQFLNFTAQLEKKPINVYVNSTLYGVLNYHSLWFNGVYRALYNPSGWFTFTDRLAKLMQGDATDAFLAYGFGDTFTRVGDGDIVIHLNDAPSGTEYWPQERAKLLDMLLPFYKDSSFAYAQNKLYYTKQQWQIPRTHDYTPRKSVKTTHPLLVLSMSLDPVCPLASAKGATKTFEGSRLIEVKGYGHCSLAMKSSCATKHIRNFLYDGILPDDHVQCEVDNEYYVKPE